VGASLGSLLLLAAFAVAARPATIVEGGFMPPTPVGTSPQTFPLFIDSFDARLGTLNSASITFVMYANFQANVFAAPTGSLPLPEVVGYQAIVPPGIIELNGIPLGQSYPLQSLPAITIAFPGSVTPISTPSLPEQTKSSVFPFLLSSLELPVGNAPLRSPLGFLSRWSATRTFGVGCRAVAACTGNRGRAGGFNRGGLLS
jgi:hypothetical protein